MDQAAVLEQLKTLHREIEVDDGKDPSHVTDDVQPLDGLGGFDSTLIPNVIRGLARAMGIPLAKGRRLLNPYVDAAGNKLTLRGVAKRFCDLYAKEGTTP
ncbi:MAG: hypothetical protein GIKADHBN_00246 [Phycisphaerales bacterium]|nr:hypothetical protein [Phycisphaerales bacterium]